MITSRTIGKELEKELGREYKKVLKEQKRKRDEIRKQHKREKMMDYVETSWTWNSGNYDKWFLKTSCSGRTDMPTVTSHAHATVITSSGSNKYLIPRGYKKRPGSGETGGYAVSIRASVVNEIRDSLGLRDLSHNEIVSRIFSHTEKAVYLPCTWDITAEEFIEKEDHVPTVDEMWAEYLGQTKKEEKPKRHDNLPQLILKTSLGFFLGCIREQKEVILEVFMKEEDFEGESKERVELILNPAYEIYNTASQERLMELKKQVEETLVGNEEVYLLYP